MTREKKLGRGLEDFSHLFLSSRDEKIGFLADTQRDGDGEGEGARNLPRVICIASDRKVRERAFLTLKLGLEIAKQGKKVLVLDADFGLPRLWMLMDNPAHGSILNLIAGNGEERAVGEYARGVKLITLDVDISSLSCLDAFKRNSLTRWFRKAEGEADILLVTTSPSSIHHMVVILKASSDVVVITPRQVKEMVNAYGVVKTAFHVNKDACVGIVSSGIDVPEKSEAVFGRMQKTVKQFLDQPLHYYGYIPEDKEISRSIAQKKPLSLSVSSSKTAQCITEISQSILGSGEQVGVDSPVEAKRCSFAERLFSRAS